ncbi:MAG TPA: hypothetical protein VKK61_02055, partial [Tepidisphaeraceae bacterium]|nr:hypothetical protein [Tepidisphaeraceae bacterium]
ASDTQPTETNPFGFGYKYPNRVKLQYLSIPHDQLRKAVQSSKDDYSWEVEANRYYLKNLDQFPTTQPTQTDQFSLIKPTTQPTTKPFTEVRDQIIARLIDPQIEKLQRQVALELSTRLDQDFLAYQKNPQAISPSYESFDYLKNLAKEIQNKYHVTLTVASIGDSFKTAKELRLLPGIGQLSQFPDYATTHVETFVPADQKDSANVLHLFQSTKPLTDYQGGDAYIFRVIAADPSHKPASLAEVKDQVESDWKHAQAYDLAKAEAQKLLDAAKKSGLAAAASSRNLITTGPYALAANAPIENYNKLSVRTQFTFVRDTYALLGQLRAKQQKPVALIEMPSDWKVAVAELIAVESQLKPDQLDLVESQARQGILQESTVGLASAWFDYNSLVQRLNYQDDTHHAKQ